MTKDQARRLAKKIFDEFGSQIREAVRGTSISPKFIAGLVGNEAGKDRQGNIRRAATRFEPHIYTRLKRVAATKGAKYNNITHAQLADASDESLRALARSYEATQMMGYWCIILGCTLADLKNPDKHFFYTVKLLQLNGFPSRPSEAKMDSEMRQWNTGRETGKTYHANYVPNAQLIREAYGEIESGHAARTVNERVNISATAAPTSDPVTKPTSTIEPITPPAGDQTIPNGTQTQEPINTETPPTLPPPEIPPAAVDTTQTVTSMEQGDNGDSVETVTKTTATAPGETVTVKEVAVGIWTKVVTGIGAVTALGINFGTIFESKITELTLNHVITLVVGTALLIFATWYFKSRQAAADKKTGLLIEKAADQNQNTIVLQQK